MRIEVSSEKRLFATITEKFNAYRQTKDKIGLGLEHIDPLSNEKTKGYLEKKYPIAYNQFKLSNKDIFEFFEEKGISIDYYQPQGIRSKGTYTIKVKFTRESNLRILGRVSNYICFPGLASEYLAIHKSIEKGLLFVEKLNSKKPHPEKRRSKTK